MHGGGDFRNDSRNDFEAAQGRERGAYDRESVSEFSEEEDEDDDIEAEREAAGDIMLLVRATSHDPFVHLQAASLGGSRGRLGRGSSSRGAGGI